MIRQQKKRGRPLPTSMDDPPESARQPRSKQKYRPRAVSMQPRASWGEGPGPAAVRADRCVRQNRGTTGEKSSRGIMSASTRALRTSASAAATSSRCSLQVGPGIQVVVRLLPECVHPLQGTAKPADVVACARGLEAGIDGSVLQAAMRQAVPARDLLANQQVHRVVRTAQRRAHPRHDDLAAGQWRVIDGRDELVRNGKEAGRREHAVTGGRGNRSRST